MEGKKISTVKNDKIMELTEHEDAIKIVIRYDLLNRNNSVNASHMRTIDVYMADENGILDCVYSETESVGCRMGKTKSGVAGAINLLYDLLLEHNDAYYPKSVISKFF